MILPSLSWLHGLDWGTSWRNSETSIFTSFSLLLTYTRWNYSSQNYWSYFTICNKLHKFYVLTLLGLISSGIWIEFLCLFMDFMQGVKTLNYLDFTALLVWIHKDIPSFFITYNTPQLGGIHYTQFFFNNN